MTQVNCFKLIRESQFITMDPHTKYYLKANQI